MYLQTITFNILYNIILYSTLLVVRFTYAICRFRLFIYFFFVFYCHSAVSTCAFCAASCYLAIGNLNLSNHRVKCNRETALAPGIRYLKTMRFRRFQINHYWCFHQKFECYSRVQLFIPWPFRELFLR